MTAIHATKLYTGSPFTVSSLQELDLPRGTVSKGTWQLGGDTTGAMDVIPVIVVQGAEEGPTLWIQGCIHGDEPSAAWVVSSLAREVDPKALKGRLILLPALNVTAFRARQTPTPIDNVDLYRAFPGNPTGSYTYQIAYAIKQDLLNVADAMIDVHAGTSIHVCIEFTSYPGGLKASGKAEAMALVTGSPIVVRRNVQSEAEEHIMFMYACAQGIPSIMISNGGHRRVEPEIFQPLINQCLNVMCHLGMIPGEPVEPDWSKLLEGIYYTFCTEGGFVFNEVKNGDWLEKGQVIARIYNIYGEEVEAVRCPHTKALLIESASGVLYPGELIAEFFVPMS
jgi:predicted deacylase